jgi:hypothetical protein
MINRVFTDLSHCGGIMDLKRGDTDESDGNDDLRPDERERTPQG